MSFYKNTGIEIVHPRKGQSLKPGQIMCLDIKERRELLDADKVRSLYAGMSYAESVERYFNQKSARYFRVLDIKLKSRDDTSFCVNCSLVGPGGFCMRGMFPGSSCKVLPERNGEYHHTSFEEIEL